METKVKISSIAKFNHCFGCGVCVTACPQQAIVMALNENGFYSPHVNDNCINCSLCLKVCSFNNLEKLTFKTPLKAFAGWSNNNIVRENSTSGGVMTELSLMALSKGYKIIAVRYNYLQKRAEHFIIDKPEQWEAAQGSKYLQSYTIDALKEIDFSQKHIVIGTPCLISSFQQLLKLKRSEANFVLIDFFCHGVPSYLMWEKYLDIIEGHTGSPTLIKWRNKDNGWQDSTAIKAKGEKGNYLSFLSKGDLFFRFFLRDRCLNSCCYDKCIFKQHNSNADIRLGDFWGEKYSKNQLGVNSILVFSKQGDELLRNCTNCKLEVTDIDNATKGQLSKNPRRPKSFSYVNSALKNDASTLQLINQKAERIEAVFRLISVKFYRKQMKRVLKLFKTE